MIIETLPLGPLETNCYLLGDPDTQEGMLIDPGFDEELVLERIKALDLKIRWILNTHGHLDHSGAVEPLRVLLSARYAIHPRDQFLLDSLVDQAMMFGLPIPLVPRVDHSLVPGETIQAGGISLQVIHTPGHTPGSVSFAGPGMVFTGDLLFAGGVGRTDLTGGSHPDLLKSIREGILPLGDDTLVYPGHGPQTRVGQERLHNPFLQD